MIFAGRQILKYALLPQILPRFKALFDEGFGFSAYCMAQIFRNTGLLAPQHPYCNPANIGRFGIRHVLGRAAMNLRPSVRHIDQIGVFTLVLGGCCLLAVQIFLLIAALLVQLAHAATLPTTFAGFFQSPDPLNDISYMILDRIFGIPGLFDSCVAMNQPCLGDPLSGGPIPMGFNTPFRDLLAFYSQGLMIVATIILLYLVVTMIAEMSESGVFFGRRFNRVWAPLRLVAAIGLLIPMSYNLNAAQYIALYVTKWGSALATNAWAFYVADFTAPQTLAGAPEKLVSKPKPQTLNDLLQFMTMAQSCWLAYNQLYATGPEKVSIDAYAVRNSSSAPSYLTLDALNTINGANTSFYDIQKWFDFGDITIVFGDQGTDAAHQKYKAGVIPYCGELVLPTARIEKPTSGPYKDGIDHLDLLYFALVYYTWYGLGIPVSFTPLTPQSDPLTLAYIIVQHVLNNNDSSFPAQPAYDYGLNGPKIEPIENMVSNFNNVMKERLDDAYTEMITAPATNDLWGNSATQYGWAGAAIWYNKIASVNGAFAQAAADEPVIVKYPMISEMVQEANQKASPTVSGEDRFNPKLPQPEHGADLSFLKDNRDTMIADVLYKSYKAFLDVQDSVINHKTGNPVTDSISAVFKKSGLWALRDNYDVYPLAAMALLGKTLLTHNMMAFGSGAAAGLLGIMGKKTMIGGMAKMLSSLLMSIAFIGFAAGILLYYIVPLFPFIYFFFAVVAWAKTVFEAMIGVPLWALAHLRYDGQGFPTAQSMYGYYLLIDLFIRPCLIVFGLIAAMTIFEALVKTLNLTFNLVTSNLSGYDATGAAAYAAGTVGSYEYSRSPIDELAFTLIYAVICYLLALSSFKMVDVFPNNIMRWMGSGAKGLGSLVRDDSGEMVAEKMTSSTNRIAGNMQMAAGNMGGYITQISGK